MRRYRRNNSINKTMGITFILLMFIVGIAGYSYSHWTKTINIHGTITTGTWEEKIASIRIMKTLNGSFTNATTGEDISTPTNLVHVGTNESAGWPTKFQLIITVENNGTVDTDNVVADIILNPVEPINYTASQGTVEWYKNITYNGEFVKNYLNWTIGILHPNERATLEIWIQTVRNPSRKYEPTSENQTIEINRGANLTATSELGTLFAGTEAIILTIVDDGILGNNLAIIMPTLPYSTPWASDTKYSP